MQNPLILWGVGVFVLCDISLQPMEKRHEKMEIVSLKVASIMEPGCSTSWRRQRERALERQFEAGKEPRWAVTHGASTQTLSRASSLVLLRILFFLVLTRFLSTLFVD
jgi:hypothetical protein